MSLINSSLIDNTLLTARHIQDENENSTKIVYWGYATRVMPCTSDPGSCEYLDAVYWMHSVSMLYTFIFWLVLGVILLCLLFNNILRPARNDGEHAKQGLWYRNRRAVAAARRRYLLPESMAWLFPNTTRVQILVLVTLVCYLTVFSFIGIVYKTWVTPIEDSHLHNTRSGLGGFSDRVGAFAFALTPLTIALCARDSILSLITGIPYLHFNFLHRWTGRIILIQSFIHAISWTYIEGKLYQPQPTQYTEWIAQRYMVWGIVAQSLITFLFVFSLRPVIRWTGYEFFRKSHLIVAGLYLGACYAHWEQLACWMIASLILLGIDLLIRGFRMCLIHLGYKNKDQGFGFRSITSKIEAFKDPSGTIVRMTFTHKHTPWKIGQHFYLTFPSLGIWQSHPFTTASVPSANSDMQSHTYIIRARSGETGRLAALADSFPRPKDNRFETPVILTGPYGGSIVDDEASNMLAISGGTGISFTLPLVQAALANKHSATDNIELIWIVRHIENLLWMGPELKALKARLDPSSALSSSPSKAKKSANKTDDFGDEEKKAAPKVTVTPSTLKRFRIRIFVTRPPQATPSHTHHDFLPMEKELGFSSASSSTHIIRGREMQALIRESPDFHIVYLQGERPGIDGMVEKFMEETVEEGRTRVIGSGPPQLGTEIRRAVAERNREGGVWRGDERRDVECVWDDRMG